MNKKFNSSLKSFITTIFIFTLFRCAHYPENQPVTDLGSLNNYFPRLSKFEKNKRDDILLILAFSGGGTRAASLAYGVLKGLDKIDLPSPLGSNQTHTLLDEVDTISSVSGGSFTASYFGLRGRDGFTDFENQFLYRNVQRGIFLRILSPLNWWKLASRKYGRSELAAQYYDKILFNNATLGQIFDNKNSPNIGIMATDIGDGNPFSFTKTTFSLLCSNYETFPISRAVAASSAFPGAFSSITIINYADQCQNALDMDIQAIKKRSDRLGHLGQAVSTYRDIHRKPFVHLQDGGIADNLGLRGPLNAARYGIYKAKTYPELAAKFPSKIAFIVVNAETSSEGYFNKLDVTPNMMSLLWETFSIFIKNYNTETLELLKSSLKDWEILSRKDPAIKKPFKFYTAEISFRNLQDKNREKKFLALPTSLTLSKNEVNDLIEVGQELLFQEPEFQEFVKDLGGKFPNNPSLVPKNISKK